MVIWIILGILSGIGMTAFGVFAFFLVKWIQGLTRVMQDTNRLLKSLVESSDLTTSLKSFKEIVQTGQDMLKMMGSLNTTISLFYRATITNNAAPGGEGGGESSVYAYNEEAAAIRETQDKLRQSGVNLEEPSIPTRDEAVGEQV